MKFELKLFNRNVTKEEMSNDLRFVAKKLNLDSLSQDEYNKYGKYHSSTISHKFKTWAKALEESGLQVRKYQVIQEDEIIKDLISVACKLNKNTITHAEYNEYGKYSSSAVISKFKTWFIALEKAGLKRSRNFGITNEEYFKNLEVVWEKLERQPKYLEIQKPLSLYSKGAYEQRFGSWSKALQAFVEFINNDSENENIETHFDPQDNLIPKLNEIINHKTKRNISWRLRFIILKRDNFKCAKCGRSPATDPKVILQVDHIKPWSKGGETEPENLETLCMECNIGKSNIEYE